MRLAAHYRVATTDGGAGGDWFDAVPLPGGSVALVAGDVAGHGVPSSVMMSQLRAALAALVLDGYDVAQVLARLDRFVARMPGANATTVGLAVLDPVSGELSYAGCGHPPPLVVTAAGVAGYLPADRGVPLGTVSAPPRVRRTRLDDGDVLLLFTDGLVAGPDRSLQDGLEALRVCLAETVRRRPRADLDEICRHSVHCLTGDDHGDDVSLIAVRRVAAPVTQFRREVSATPDVLPELRSGLGEWLAAAGAAPSDAADIQIAVGEAVANVIEHAYAGLGGPLLVEAHHDPSGRVWITVADSGTWRSPSVEPAARGRGLIMIRACMDTVEIDSSDTGTTLQMDRRLCGKPVLWSERPSVVAVRPERAPRTFGARVSRSPRPVLSVQGPVDATTAVRFREHLADASRGGTLPLHLDLSGVTHLASAGIQALFEFVEQMASDGRPLLLTAPPASPARYVLELTGLDHLLGPDT
jgi:anti-anti-sigma factor